LPWAASPITWTSGNEKPHAAMKNQSGTSTPTSPAPS
jgi:hypothetical protein